MQSNKLPVNRWVASFIVMFGIFVLSAQPASDIPYFGWADYLVKKSSHVAGYGLLALTYWQGFGYERGRTMHAWMLALIYSLTDEIHQAFVPGRHPSVVDVLAFDSVGAALALWLGNARHRRTKTL